MKAEKKQMIWPFLAIVAIVAVVGIVMLVMDFKDLSKGGVVGEEGALAGEAVRITSLGTYSTIEVKEQFVLNDAKGKPYTYQYLRIFFSSGRFAYIYSDER